MSKKVENGESKLNKKNLFKKAMKREILHCLVFGFFREKKVIAWKLLKIEEHILSVIDKNA